MEARDGSIIRFIDELNQLAGPVVAIAAGDPVRESPGLEAADGIVSVEEGHLVGVGQGLQLARRVVGAHGQGT